MSALQPQPPEAAPALLDVRGMTKRFGSRTVLRDVGVSLRAGEVVGLIGPNGAGKTTLFECVAGVLPAENGTVFSAGGELPPSRRYDVLFFVPDGIAPWSAQPAGRALIHFGGLFGRTCGEALDAGARLGLSSLFSLAVGSLSKGERKRFTIALGLLSTAPILLFDEPFDGLDVRQARDTSEILRREAARGRALFVSIHHLSDAAKVCDRLVLLSGGDVVGEGTLDELRTRTGLAAADLEELFLALT